MRVRWGGAGEVWWCGWVRGAAQACSADRASTAPPASSTGHARRWLVLAVVAIAQLVVVLDATIVNIALPTAQADLGFGNDDRQWIVTAYALAFGSLLLLGGRLADLFGRGLHTTRGVGPGDRVARAMRAYPDLDAEPNKYDEAERYLTRRSGKNAMRFETKRGRLDRVYAGRWAQVQYVEGCL